MMIVLDRDWKIMEGGEIFRRPTINGRHWCKLVGGEWGAFVGEFVGKAMPTMRVDASLLKDMLWFVTQFKMDDGCVDIQVVYDYDDGTEKLMMFGKPKVDGRVNWEREVECECASIEVKRIGGRSINGIPIVPGVNDCRYNDDGDCICVDVKWKERKCWCEFTQVDCVKCPAYLQWEWV